MSRVPARIVALLLAFSILAGCAQTKGTAPVHTADAASVSATATATSSPPTASASASAPPANGSMPQAAAKFPIEYSLEECLNPRMLFFIDPQAAQANLPDGYHAADATGLMRYVGFPQPPAITTGRGVAGYDFLSCAKDSVGGASATFSEVGIFIDPPNVGNATSSEATNLDLYLLSVGSDSPAWQALLESAGMPHDLVPIASMHSGQSVAPGSIHQGHGDIAAAAPLASADWAGGANGSPLTVHARYWHTESNGTMFLDFHLAESVFAESITACTHATGSTYARATGTTSCTSEPRFAAVGVGSKIAGAVHWLPGIKPTLSASGTR